MKNMVQSIQRKLGRFGIFLQASFYLLLTVGLVFVMMTVTACDCDDDGFDDCDETVLDPFKAASTIAAKNEMSYDKALAIIRATGVRPPGRAGGERVQHLLGCEVEAGAPISQVTYTWTPPVGASNFTFPQRQPELGGPPYVFVDVPPDEEIPVEFDLPLAGPYGGDRLPESLRAEPNAGLATTAYFVTDLSPATTSGPETIEPIPPSSLAARPEADVDIWRVRHWFGRAITVSSEECQQAVDLLQSEAAFAAVQLPEPAHAVTESALLPIYFNPGVELVDYDGDLDLAGEAVLRPDRFSFAANQLPAEAGKMWTTLAISNSQPLSCPTGLETEHWELYTEFYVDLSYMPDGCEGCVLDFYFCYEGQELPGGGLQRYVARQQINHTLEQLAASTNTGVHHYQGWGITCAGPLPMQLLDDPDWIKWTMAGTSAQWVTPTWPITLPHYLEGLIPSPPQIELEFDSNLAAGWTWSDGTQPITPPVTYDSPPQNVFLVGTVPADTPAGLYTVEITATLASDPSDYRLLTDLFWVGDWMPPPVEPGPVRHRIYLPLIRR